MSTIKPWFPLIALLFSGFSPVKGNQTVNVFTKQKEILDNILHSYDYRIRPAESNDDQSPTVVRVNMLVRIVNKIDDLQMQYSVQVTLRQKWLDPRLKYNNMDGKVKYLNLFEEKLWRPDLFFSNERSGYINNLMQPNLFFRIFPDGNVLYSARLSLVMTCPMNFEFFPFDTQVCSMRMASYGYTTQDVVFEWEGNNPIQMAKNIVMSHYSMERFSNGYCHSTTATGMYSCLKVDFRFNRVLGYYMLHVFLPSMMLVITSWFAFWLNVQFIMTRLFVVLSSLLVLVYRVADFNATLTQVSYIKSVDIWTGTCLTFVFVALIEVVVVEYVWRRQQKKQRRATGVLDTTDMDNTESIDLKPLMSIHTSSSTENRPQHQFNRVGRLRNFCYRLVSNLPTGPKRFDVISRYLFPVGFALFNVFYWLRNLA